MFQGHSLSILVEKIRLQLIIAITRSIDHARQRGRYLSLDHAERTKIAQSAPLRSALFLISTVIDYFT